MIVSANVGEHTLSLSFTHTHTHKYREKERESTINCIMKGGLPSGVIDPELQTFISNIPFYTKILCSSPEISKPSLQAKIEQASKKWLNFRNYKIQLSYKF